MGEPTNKQFYDKYDMCEACYYDNNDKCRCYIYTDKKINLDEEIKKIDKYFLDRKVNNG